MSAIIRLVQRQDIPGILDIYGPIIRDTPISFEAEVPSEEEMAQRIASYTKEYPWLICEIDQQIAGYAYGSSHRGRAAYRWSVEVSVYINPRFQGRGIARALYQVLFELLSFQGYHMAYAGIGLPNDESLGLHQSMGFEAIGVYKEIGNKFGKWWDTSWWQRSLSAPDKSPSLPLSIEKASQNPVWQEIIDKSGQNIRA